MCVCVRVREIALGSSCQVRDFPLDWIEDCNPIIEVNHNPFSLSSPPSPKSFVTYNRYYLAYNLVIFLCTLFVFIKIKFICYHFYVMFVITSMSICMTK